MEAAISNLSLNHSKPEGFVYDDLDDVTKRFYESRDRALASSLVPYIEPTYIHFPGRLDCYRLKYEEDRNELMADCSAKTLDYFNRTNGTDYKFDKYVDLVLSDEEHSFAVHCNFVAKPEISPLNLADFSAKLFFAEFFPMTQCVLYLTHCTMLDGAETNWREGCLMCPSGVISHPPNFEDGFKLPLENDEGFSLVPFDDNM